MSKLFIGSLSWNTDSDSLREAFSQFGEVTDSFVCRDRETGRSRGFGFITYAQESDAEKAISTMDGSDLDGRQIKVDKASERSSGGGSGGYSGGRREGGGGGGYNGGRREGGGGYGGRSEGRSEGGYGGRSEGGYGGRSEGGNRGDGGYGGRSNGGGNGGYGGY